MVERGDRGVEKRSKVLEVTLSWAGTPDDLDLHLMSPSGRHYAAYADTTGYSGDTNPKSFRVPDPEAGAVADLGGRHARVRANQFRRGNFGFQQPAPARLARKLSANLQTFVVTCATMPRSAWLLIAFAACFGRCAPAKRLPSHQKDSASPATVSGIILTTDPATDRVFVSHGTEVDVVDGKKGEVIGKITGLKLVHGIALAPEFNHGFISDGGANQVVVFDMKTLAKIGEVPAGMNPDGIIYDPASKRVFAFNGRSASATAVDAEKGTLAGTVTLEGKPEFPAPDGKGHVYVNIEDKSEVMEIDSKALTVLNKWPLAPCEEPSGMAMDTKTRRIFSGCDNKMMSVMNADTGKVVATVPIGDGVDATWFDPGTKYGFQFVRAGRRADRDSRRFARQIYRGGKREDGERRADHGARSQDSHGLPRPGASGNAASR